MFKYDLKANSAFLKRYINEPALMTQISLMHKILLYTEYELSQSDKSYILYICNLNYYIIFIKINYIYY